LQGSTTILSSLKHSSARESQCGILSYLHFCSLGVCRFQVWLKLLLEQSWINVSSTIWQTLHASFSTTGANQPSETNARKLASQAALLPMCLPESSL
jgi:hypothetical protein